MEKGLQSISNYKEKEEMTKRKTTKKRTRNQSHRKDDPMNLIGYGIKGIVGVTALGITANALSDIAKNSH